MSALTSVDSVRRSAAIRQIRLAEVRIAQFKESLTAVSLLKPSEERDAIMARYRKMIMWEKKYILDRNWALRPPEEEPKETWL